MGPNGTQWDPMVASASHLQPPYAHVTFFPILNSLPIIIMPSPHGEAAPARALRPTTGLVPLTARTSALLWRIRAVRCLRLSKRALSAREFVTLFGLPSTCMHELWEHTHNAMRANRLSPHHLLWTLHYLKTYPKEDAAKSTWDVSRNTWSQKVDAILDVLEVQLPPVCDSDI